jgi:hypothetical protein
MINHSDRKGISLRAIPYGQKTRPGRSPEPEIIPLRTINQARRGNEYAAHHSAPRVAEQSAVFNLQLIEDLAQRQCAPSVFSRR